LSPVAMAVRPHLATNGRDRPRVGGGRLFANALGGLGGAGLRQGAFRRTGAACSKASADNFLSGSKQQELVPRSNANAPVDEQRKAFLEFCLGGESVVKEPAKVDKQVHSARSDAADWKCKACALDNHPRNSECAACGTSRPQALIRVECVGPIWSNNEAKAKVNAWLARTGRANELEWTGSWWSKDGTSYANFRKIQGSSTPAAEPTPAEEPAAEPTPAEEPTPAAELTAATPTPASIIPDRTTRRRRLSVVPDGDVGLSVYSFDRNIACVIHSACIIPDGTTRIGLLQLEFSVPTQGCTVGFELAARSRLSWIGGQSTCQRIENQQTSHQHISGKFIYEKVPCDRKLTFMFGTVGYSGLDFGIFDTFERQDAEQERKEVEEQRRCQKEADEQQRLKDLQEQQRLEAERRCKDAENRRQHEETIVDQRKKADDNESPRDTEDSAAASTADSSDEPSKHDDSSVAVPCTNDVQRLAAQRVEAGCVMMTMGGDSDSEDGSLDENDQSFDGVDLDDMYNFDPSLVADAIQRGAGFEEIRDTIQEALAESFEQRVVSAFDPYLEQRPAMPSDVTGSMTPEALSPREQNEPSVPPLAAKSRRRSTLSRHVVEDAVAEAKIRRQSQVGVQEHDAEVQLAFDEESKNARKLRRASLGKTIEILEEVGLEDKDVSSEQIAEQANMIQDAIIAARHRHRKSISRAVEQLAIDKKEGGDPEAVEELQSTEESTSFLGSQEVSSIGRRIQEVVSAAYQRQQEVWDWMGHSGDSSADWGQWGYWSNAPYDSSYDASYRASCDASCYAGTYSYQDNAAAGMGTSYPQSQGASGLGYAEHYSTEMSIQGSIDHSAPGYAADGLFVSPDTSTQGSIKNSAARYAADGLFYGASNQCQGYQGYQ